MYIEKCNDIDCKDCPAFADGLMCKYWARVNLDLASEFWCKANGIDLNVLD